MDEHQWQVVYQFMIGIQNTLDEILSELKEKKETAPSDAERYDL